MNIEELPEINGFFRTILDAMPLPIFIVDSDVHIFAFNQAASQMLNKEPKAVLRRRAGETLHCVHSTEVAEGCGAAPSCKDCVIRNSVITSFRDHKMVRQKARMEQTEDGRAEIKEVYLLVTAVPIYHDGIELVLLILQDISELVKLKSILPICSNCKKIRDDAQYWHSVEKYFKDHMDLSFSHSLCPECVRKLYPGFLEKMEAQPPK